MAIDLQDLDKVQALVPGLPDNFKEVDVLVNNAGEWLSHCYQHTSILESKIT